jgi:hypothetical protein
MSTRPIAHIFDRNRPIRGTAMTERTESCWSWGESHEFRVVDEHLAWGAAADQPRPAELTEAVRQCVAEGSTLIFYSDAVLSDDPDTVQWVREELGARAISVAGGNAKDEPS